MIEFMKMTDFPRGTLYDILADAYSYDPRNRQIWDANWKETDDFFYDNPDIADKYSLVTCLDGKPIGFVTWDPRHRPEYVEIGHNGIREQYKGRGYGRLQLEEALRRIREYKGLKRIIVGTNSNLIARGIMSQSALCGTTGSQTERKAHIPGTVSCMKFSFFASSLSMMIREKSRTELTTTSLTAVRR